MPNWKKVITSGSDAYLGSVTVPGPVINNFTASVAVTALNTYNSTALNSGTVQQFATPTASWIVEHNLSELWPMVTVWQEDPAWTYNIVIPNSITSLDADRVEITFTEAIKGYVNVSRAGHVVSGSLPWTNLIGDANVTASLNVYGGFTGSLLGTASSANSSSYAVTSSYLITQTISSSAGNVTPSVLPLTANTQQLIYSSTNKKYSLADGYEGQIMYFVATPTDKTPPYSVEIICTGRYTDPQNKSETAINGTWTPFNDYISSPMYSTYAIFLNRAWNFSSGIFTP
jgi:hypothetical protein